MPRPDLAALSILVSVARRRSFRAAARDLSLSPSAVSHAIAGLEARLGVRLLERTTRSVAPTEAGRKLLAQLEPALHEIDAALTSTAEAHTQPSGPLRITVPRSAAHHLLFPQLQDFLGRYPEICVEIHADDGFVDLVAAGFDAGIRFGESLQRDMIAVRIGPEQRLVALAAPDFLNRHPPPRHPRDLVDLPCIALRFAGGALYRWEFEKDGETIEVDVGGGQLVLNDNRLILEAVRAGLGIGFVIERMADAAIARGEVKRVLEDWCPTFPGFFLYYTSRRQMRPALRAFIDAFTGR